ncbi:ComEC/Rec2 family competence protein [Massilia sp. PWRC2]|uniref:ComEC/Rec2 family competence protein n=1 Tax=Massilia sp. PWRC2 TaxID=2804626 RepID=UPI003CF91C74
MRCAIVGFVAGAMALQTCASLPPGELLCGLALGAVGLLLLLRGALRAAIAGAMLGLCWAALLASASLAPQLAEADEGRNLTVVGTIASLPYRFEQGVRFQFTVEQVVGGASAAPLPPRLALSWYAGVGGRQGPQTPVPAVLPGERWQLAVRLQRPHGSANPDGFDYEMVLLEQGVRATGYVRTEAGSNQRLAPFVFNFGNLVERSRAVLRARILRALPAKPYAGVIVALVVGDQRAIEQDDWQLFARSGISHLISVSGL